MKHLWKWGVLTIVIVVVSAQNVRVDLYTRQCVEELMLSTNSWSDEFPGDPFDGEGPGCQSKDTENSYVYAVQKEEFQIEGERFFSVLKIPTTEVTCCGIGQVPCTFGFYFSDGYIEIMSEEELDKLGIRH